MKNNCKDKTSEPILDSRPRANCDQECWVKDRLKTVIRMAIKLSREHKCGGDDNLLESSLDGLVNGAAVEIIHTLGMLPEYTHLKKIRYISSEYSQYVIPSNLEQ